MSTEQFNKDWLTQLQIWEDTPVLHFWRIHKYGKELSPLNKDVVYRQARGFRWLSHNLCKLQKDGSQMLMVSPSQERGELYKRVHRDKRHFGIHRILDRLKINY